jgi:hypothetical protein
MVSVEIPRQAMLVACHTIINTHEQSNGGYLSSAARLALLNARRQDGYLVECSPVVATELSRWFRRTAEPLLASLDEAELLAGQDCRDAADQLGHAAGSNAPPA